MREVASDDPVRYRMYDPCEDKEWTSDHLTSILVICGLVTVRNARAARDEDDDDDRIFLRAHQDKDDILIFVIKINNEEIMLSALKGLTMHEYMAEMKEHGVVPESFSISVH